MNQSEHQQRSREFSRALNMPIHALSFIRDNKYCTIYSARTDNEKVIIKQYKGDDTHLAENEGKACNFYHELAKDDPSFEDGRTLRFCKEHNLLCLSFVEGERLSDIVNRARFSPLEKKRALHAMSLVGHFVRKMYETSVEVPAGSPARGEEALDPFYFEYLDYCSSNLQTLPVLGRTVFRNASDSASRMGQDLRSIKIRPSFAHRDLVFQNIHVSSNKVGIIDFANASFHGHVLDDYYCLYTALNAMILPPGWKRKLWDAFESAASISAFTPSEHRFFSAFHKRRWLWITPRAKGPTAWLRLLMPDIRGASKFR